jgi:hypothetical protein
VCHPTELTSCIDHIIVMNDLLFLYVKNGVESFNCTVCFEMLMSIIMMNRWNDGDVFHVAAV